MDIETLIVYASKEAVIENLRDIGFDDDMICDILSNLKDDEIESVLSLLEQRRNRLLSMVHTIERQIDCLDYFVYHIKRG